MSSQENFGTDDTIMAELIARIQDSIPPYQGKDPNTMDDWYCKGCYTDYEEKSLELKKCARCQIARYCSVGCQKNDLYEHKDECIAIRNYTRAVAKQQDYLRTCRDFSFQVNAPPVDMFAHHTGHFWGIMETRDYCRARNNLALELSYMAHEYEAKPLLELILRHRLELLRLISSDNLGLRDLVPFDLLNVNRDTDCYAFIQHWIARDGDDLSSTHANTVEGEWFYPTLEAVDRLNDVFEGREPEKYYSLAFLTAMAQIKLRIIAQYESQVKQVGEFAHTKTGEKLGTDPLQHIQRHLTTTSDGIELTPEIIAQQEKHLDRYFRIINENNPTLLRAMVNPGPLMDMESPYSYQMGKPSEAYGIVRTCKRMFARLPGAKARMERVVGKNPMYSCVD